MRIPTHDYAAAMSLLAEIADLANKIHALHTCYTADTTEEERERMDALRAAMVEEANALKAKVRRGEWRGA